MLKLITEQSLHTIKKDLWEKRYLFLFNLSIDPIFLTDENFRLVDCNEAFLELFGKDFSFAKKLSIRSIFNQESHFRLFKKIIKKSSQLENYKVDLKTISNSPTTCLLNCILVSNLQSTSHQYQGLVRIVSFTNNETENDSYLTERIAMTEKVSRSIAHEVRNPLTNLSLALEQLRSEMPTMTESTNLYASIMERNISRIEKLISKMLNHKKVKHINLKFESLEAVINDTLKKAANQTQLKGIIIFKSFGNSIPSILLDKEQIQIALLNIILNSLEVMEPSKGILRIRTFIKNDRVTISIVDNSKISLGMDKGKFHPVSIVDSKTKSETRLFESKYILNFHNAVLDIKSAINGSSTYFIHFKTVE